MKNSTVSTVSTVNTNSIQIVKGRLLTDSEVSFIWDIVKTCDFARANLVSVSDEMLMQIQFDAHSQRLGLSRYDRFILNRICCLVVGIRYSFLNYKTLINELLTKYPVISLYGIFRRFEADYMKHCSKVDASGNPLLGIFELPLSAYRYVKNELVLYAEMWFEFSENPHRTWDKIWHIYTYTLESLVPVDFKSTSIAKACKRLFGESEKRLEKFFGGTAFWLAVKCILSSKLRLKQPEVQSLFRPENFFAAKAFIAIYPTMKMSQKRRFLAKDKYDKAAYLMQSLKHSKTQKRLFNEYLNASKLILNQR